MPGSQNFCITNVWNRFLLGRILCCQQCFLIHVSGLIKIAEQFNLNLLAPRKKIVVLLIGNHSAGKSSFINWWVIYAVDWVLYRLTHETMLTALSGEFEMARYLCLWVDAFWMIPLGGIWKPFGYQECVLCHVLRC